jgi:hypothetical protein
MLFHNDLKMNDLISNILAELIMWVYVKIPSFVETSMMQLV